MFINHSRPSAKSAGLAAFLTSRNIPSLPVVQCMLAGKQRRAEFSKISKTIFLLRNCE